MKAKTKNPIGVHNAGNPNDVQLAASLAVLAKVQAEAVEPDTVVAPTLEALIAEHARLKALDNAAWTVVGDLTEALETSETGHPMPCVQTSYLLLGRDADGNDIKEPRYSYSENEIRKVFTSHRDGQLSMFRGPKQEETRKRVTANYNANMEAKLAEFRRLQAEYDRRERDSGLTDALAEASRLADEVRGIESRIVALVPATLVEAVQKAAWCAQAYRSDDAYLYDHANGHENNPLLAALEAIGKSAAKSDASPDLLNAIREHEAAYVAWTATAPEDGALPEDTPEDRAAHEAERRLIFAPCRSYTDILAKIGYIYHRKTAAAQDAYDAVVGRNDDSHGFLGSLIGIEAPEMRAAADEAGNDTLIDVIQAYRAGVKAYADHPEFSSHDEENEVAEATYGVHADKLDKWDAPATSREEAMEALRFALEDAAQWCGSVTTSTMIKAALGYLEGGERVPGGGASTGQAVATASPTIPEMYEEWLAVRNAPLDGTDEEMDEGLSRYQILQARIIAAEPQTPRDVAIMFIVDSDYMESDHSEEFESRVRQIACQSAS